MDIRGTKARLVAKELIENGGTLSSAMRKRGYSEAYIRNNRMKQTKTFQKAMKTELELIREKKTLLLEGITADKVAKEGAGRLASASTDLIKAEQLLTGGATERVQYVIKRG